MRPFIYRTLWLMLSTVVFTAPGSGSPLDSKLLPLVPPGAEIVAGFKTHTAGQQGSGRLLMSTHNARLDLDDWQALAGVDSKRVVDEVVEVGASSADGRLTDHLLLVAGQFDSQRIFKAAKLNGAESSVFGDETVLLIKPFRRELGSMATTRWLVILKDRIAMLGTEGMVQNALHRHATHADIDMALMERLAQMRRDVTSWTIMVGSSTTEGSLGITQPNSILTRLIKGTELLMIGTRFGAKVRVDFSLHVRNDRDSELLREKATSLADVFARGAPGRTGARQAKENFGKLSFEPNRMKGSVEFSLNDFDRWNEQGGFGRLMQEPSARGE